MPWTPLRRAAALGLVVLFEAPQALAEDWDRQRAVELASQLEAILDTLVATAQKAAPQETAMQQRTRGAAVLEMKNARDLGREYAQKMLGFDPMQRPKATSAAPEQKGSVVGGAAKGAIVGVAAGAIAGDAGKGAAIGAASGGLLGGMPKRQSRNDQDRWARDQNAQCSVDDKQILQGAENGRGGSLVIDEETGDMSPRPSPTRRPASSCSAPAPPSRSTS